LHNTPNVASFTADCKMIMLVYHLVTNIQYRSRKPEVVITFQVSLIQRHDEFKNWLDIKIATFHPVRQ